MPRDLKRFYGDGHLHFITFSCDRGCPFLGSARRRDLVLRIAVPFAQIAERIAEREF